MRILITAFEPFDNRDTNLSKETLLKLDSKFSNNLIEKLYLPVAINSSFSTLKTKVEEFKPDIIILTGEAINRQKISIEIKAKNIISKSISPIDEIDLSKTNTIVLDGPKYIFSDFPTVEALSQLLTNSIPTILSNDAGGYVCNALYYQTMYAFKNIPSVFIHFPSLDILKLEDLISALETIILSL